METGRWQFGRNCLPPGLNSGRVLNNNKEIATTVQLLGAYSQSATGLQLIVFQTVAMTHKMMLNKPPYNIHKKFNINYQYDTMVKKKKSKRLYPSPCEKLQSHVEKWAGSNIPVD